MSIKTWTFVRVKSNGFWVREVEPPKRKGTGPCYPYSPLQGPIAFEVFHFHF